MAEKLLTLESKLQDKMGFMLSEKVQFEAKIRAKMQVKDSVHQDYQDALKQKESLESDFILKFKSMQAGLKTLEHRINSDSHQCIVLEGERETLKTAIGRAQIKLSSMGEMEAKLDKQLEEILGRAVNGVDLAMLYRLDLKTLTKLNSNHKLDGFVKHFVRKSY